MQVVSSHQIGLFYVEVHSYHAFDLMDWPSKILLQSCLFENLNIVIKVVAL
jgi:hypothetical protein